MEAIKSIKRGGGRRRFGCLLLAILVGLAMRAGLDWIWSPAAGSGGCRGAREVQTRGHAGTSPRLRRRAATPGRRSSRADARPRGTATPEDEDEMRAREK